MLESQGETETQTYTRWKDDHEGEPQRPFRLWDAKEKHDIRYRYYGDKRHAMNAALIETAWATVGTSIEVYDCRTARHFATFTRHSTGQITRWLRNEGATH